jgi:hypothetical protein
MSITDWVQTWDFEAFVLYVSLGWIVVVVAVTAVYVKFSATRRIR